MRIGAYAPGSFTHELAVALFPEEEIAVLRDPTAVIAAASSGDVDLGLVPFFNLYAKTRGVPVRYRLLLESEIFVQEIIGRPIPLCLAGIAGTRPEHVERLFFMKVIGPQCDGFVHDNLPSLKQVIEEGILTTPEAMRRAAEAGPGAAAVGPRKAALEAGLAIIAEGIENSDNTTYFFLISNTLSGEPPRELLCVELAAGLSEEAAVEFLPDLLSANDYLVYDLWLEDKTASGERNHLAIVEVEAPEPQRGRGGLRECVQVVSWRMIGRIRSWREVRLDKSLRRC